MKYITFQPQQELKEFISHFWELRQDNSQLKSPPYYLTANSLTELTFFFSNKVHSTELLLSSIQGQTDRGLRIHANPTVDIFGVSIFPYAVPYLFSTPAKEIINHSIHIGELLGETSKVIMEKMMNASTSEAKISILTQYFLSVLDDPPRKDHRIIQAVQFIRRQNGNVNIRKLADYFCLSERQFERRFTTHVGFAPKLYSRIVRFESDLNSHQVGYSLTETAYNHGYYDQAHFIRDFRAFSDLTPTEYFSFLPS